MRAAIAVKKAPVRLVHLISSLNVGGAQMHLFKTVTRFNPDRIASTVVSLVPGGKVANRLRAQGVTVLDLGMRPGSPNPLALFRLAVLLGRLKPQMLQTYLYHADLLGYLAAKLTGIPCLLWNLRQSRMDFSCYRRTTSLTVRLCARLSRGVNRILVNSRAGLIAHGLMGYDASRMLVVPNGFNLGRFRPNPANYQDVRRELKLDPETRLLGMLARFDPQKDHENFLKAARQVIKKFPRVHFILAGKGLSPENPSLSRLLKENPVSPRNLTLLGERHDTPRLLAGLDVYVSSSAFGEGFANAIGEAMACGVPCVVTDVGDSALIVGETGLVVPPRQPRDLSRALGQALSWTPDEWSSRGQTARARIRDNYDINNIVAHLESLYLDLAA